MKTEKRPVEITVAGELPGFEYGGCRGVFLNLGLDVEMDGVTYHLSSKLCGKNGNGRSHRHGRTGAEWAADSVKTSGVRQKTIALQCQSGYNGSR